jgi:hypothetical protein
MAETWQQPRGDSDMTQKNRHPSNVDVNPQATKEALLEALHDMKDILKQTIAELS